MEPDCYCGHAADEHEDGASGHLACTIPGCDCIAYEADGDE